MNLFQNGIPTDALMDRLRWVESRGDPNAVSPAGALGPYQIMPPTAAQPGYGVPSISLDAVLDPTRSRDWAKKYLTAMYGRYNSPTLALAAYNAGPGAVDAAGGNIAALPAETRNYVQQFDAPAPQALQAPAQPRPAPALAPAMVSPPMAFPPPPPPPPAESVNLADIFAAQPAPQRPQTIAYVGGERRIY